MTTAEACETSMEVWMKSMEANMNVVTNEIKQLKVRESSGNGGEILIESSIVKPEP